MPPFAPKAQKHTKKTDRNTDPPRSRHPIADHFIEGPDYGIERPNGMDDWLIIFTARGNGQITQKNGRFLTEPNSLVLITPGHPHSYHTGPANHWDLWWIHFILPHAWLPLLNRIAPSPGVLYLSLTDPETQTAVESTIQRATAYAQRYLPHRAELAMNALHETLLWANNQISSPDTNHTNKNKNKNKKLNTNRNAPFDDRIRAALTWIDNNLTDPINVADAAKAASLSLSRFAHLFREQVGQSPQKFIEARRLHRARDLLERTNLPIAEVGRRVGFEEAFYFSRRFKQQLGLSPSAHRKRAHHL